MVKTFEEQIISVYIQKKVIREVGRKWVES